jgi:hypothetical protein
MYDWFMRQRLRTQVLLVEAMFVVIPFIGAYLAVSCGDAKL